MGMSPPSCAGTLHAAYRRPSLGKPPKRAQVLRSGGAVREKIAARGPAYAEVTA